MHPVLAKTFGGLPPQYYFRQLLFGVAFATFFFFMPKHGLQSSQIGMAIFVVISTFLYPYSRFVYESIVNFIVGENVFFVNAFVMLFVKLLTMALCFSFAIFIAPVGLAYLYYRNSKAGR